MDSHGRVSKLRQALHQHQQNASQSYDEVVAEVSQRAKKDGSVGKADIGALVAWKRLNANTRWMDNLMQTPEATVRAATAAAAKAANDLEITTPEAASAARSALAPIPGFRTGDALASAVIYALAPSRMAVYDRRAQAGLEALGLELSPKPGRYGRYMTLVEQLMTESSHNGSELSAREIDLALFALGGPSRANAR